MDKQVAYQKLVEELRALHKASRWEGSTKAVPGEGSLNSPVIFVGEAPGATEDELGRPFVGQAGKFLDQLIENIGWHRPDVYITNVVKFRPLNNRDPLPEEIEQFKPYLLREIEIIKPKMIVILGRHALEALLPGQKLTPLRGTAIKRSGQIYFVTYHPAAALYNPGLRESIISDFKKIPLFLAKLESGELTFSSPDEKSQSVLF